MAYQLSCADTGADCPASFTTESQEELMEHAVMHARAAHPELELTPEVQEEITGLVKTV